MPMQKGGPDAGAGPSQFPALAAATVQPSLSCYAGLPLHTLF